MKHLNHRTPCSELKDWAVLGVFVVGYTAFGIPGLALSYLRDLKRLHEDQDFDYEKKKLSYAHHQDQTDGEMPIDPIRHQIGMALICQQNNQWRERREHLDKALELYLKEAEHG